jgi:alkenylglycerophosphocholine hydrolase
MSKPRASGLGAPAIAVAAMAGAQHLLAEVRHFPVWSLVTKPVPVLVFLARVASSGASVLRWPVVLGLALSAIGDVVIQLPDGFVAGLGLFLLAHIAYVSGFWRARPTLLAARALPFLLFAAAMGAWVGPGTGSMALPVGVYIVAISIMMWRAAALVGAPGLPPAVGRLALAGALVFAASDSLIAIHRFVEPLPWSDAPIMLTYWLGQAGIASAAIVAGEARER